MEDVLMAKSSQDSQSDGYLYNGERDVRWERGISSESKSLSLVQRIKQAVTAFQAKRVEDRPEFGRSMVSYLDSLRRLSWGWNKYREKIDYRGEVGPLEESSLVMAVVNWTGMQLPEANPVVEKPKGKDNAYEPDWGNPAADLIRRPNPFSTWGEECGTLALDWWVGGNWYQKKVYALSDELVELWYLPSFMVEERWPNDGKNPEVPLSGPNKADNDYLSHYQYTVPGKAPVLFNRREIVHVKRSKDPKNPRRGIGAFDSVIKEIYGDNAVAAFSAAVLKNMGWARYTVSPKEKDGPSLSDTQAMAMKEQFMAAVSGENAGGVLINTIPVEVKEMGLNPADIDLSKLRMVPESRIAAVTGIPAAMLQFMVGLENGTSFAAYREARQQGYESVIIPIQSAIAEQLTWQLLPELDNTRGSRFSFDLSTVRVLQEDRDALYRRAVLALQAGGISRNQFNASLGKPPVDAEEIYYVPGTAKPMTAERIEQTAKGEIEESVLDPAMQDPATQAALAKFADMEQMFERLEAEMKGFVTK